MTSHQKSDGPAAVDAARGADGRLAPAGSRAGHQYSKTLDAEHQQKLLRTFAPCREAREQQRIQDEVKLETARLVAEDMGFDEVSPGRFEAMCSNCGAVLRFGCNGVVEDRPLASCKARGMIQARVQRALVSALKTAGGGR